MSNENKNTDYNVYLGLRGEEFKNFLTKLLTMGKIKPKYINSLLNRKALSLYNNAFTASCIDPINNYEQFELLGDSTANKFLVWYAYRKYPQLHCTNGVPIIARLKINYCSKEVFAPLAEELGFWPYISAIIDSEDNIICRTRNKKDLLEDTFEAFIGCTEFLLDKKYGVGVGYSIVYTILSNIYDKHVQISLKYEDLYDAKTRMKELFDAYKTTLGSWKILSVREEKFTKATVYQIPPGVNHQPIVRFGQNYKKICFPRSDWIVITSSTGSKKSIAEQNAAQKAINILNKNGYVKAVLDKYNFLCN